MTISRKLFAYFFREKTNVFGNRREAVVRMSIPWLLYYNIEWNAFSGMIFGGFFTSLCLRARFKVSRDFIGGPFTDFFRIYIVVCTPSVSYRGCFVLYGNVFDIFLLYMKGMGLLKFCTYIFIEKYERNVSAWKRKW